MPVDLLSATLPHAGFLAAALLCDAHTNVCGPDYKSVYLLFPLGLGVFLALYVCIVVYVAYQHTKAAREDTDTATATLNESTSTVATKTTLIESTSTVASWAYWLSAIALLVEVTHRWCWPEEGRAPRCQPWTSIATTATTTASTNGACTNASVAGCGYHFPSASDLPAGGDCSCLDVITTGVATCAFMAIVLPTFDSNCGLGGVKNVLCRLFWLTVIIAGVAVWTGYT